MNEALQRAEAEIRIDQVNAVLDYLYGKISLFSVSSFIGGKTEDISETRARLRLAKQELGVKEYK